MTRFLPLGFTVLGLIILLGLGTWQLQRLAWKEDLIAQRQAGLAMPPADFPSDAVDWEDFEFRIVKLSGSFRHDLEQLFGVETKSGVLGYRVLTPLIRSDGPAVLVDRGWVPADKADPAARTEGQPSGAVQVEGIARYRLNDRPGWFTPENDQASRHWYSYDLPAMENALGLDLAPLVVEADATPNPGGLPVGGRTRVTLTNNHLQYAITWYGLAAALIGVYIVFRRHQAGARSPS
ncbi:MAG: SURF1 family protein [Geminicoccaceae bacterium]|jgi:surfeit locus 1 family protein